MSERPDEPNAPRALDAEHVGAPAGSIELQGMLVPTAGWRAAAEVS